MPEFSPRNPLRERVATAGSIFIAQNSLGDSSRGSSHHRHHDNSRDLRAAVGGNQAPPLRR